MDESTDQLGRLHRIFINALDLLDTQGREPDRWEEECLSYALGAMACGLYPAAEVELAARPKSLSCSKASRAVSPRRCCVTDSFMC